MPERSKLQLDLKLTDVLSWLFPRRSQPSDKPIWIDAVDPNKKSLSPRQMEMWVKRLGIGLRNLGLKENDVVMIHSTNHIFVPVVYLGVAGHGYVFSGCNPAYNASEITYQIKTTGAKVLFVDPTLLDVAIEGAAKTALRSDHIFLFNDDVCEPMRGLKDWRSLLGSEEEAKSWRWRTMSSDEAIKRTAVLNFSSGTTGLPKGVMISHQNIIANVEQSLYMRQLQTEEASSYQEPTDEERWLGFLPLYHAYGQLWSISAACKNLTPVFFMRTFNYTQWLSHIQNHRITHIQTAPPIVVMLAKRPETKNYDLSSLRNILCGAAPLSKELQNEVSSTIGKNLKIVQTWGMTEVTCSSLHVPGLAYDDSGSVGLIDPNCEMKLIDDDGKEVGDDERGEIHVKGPNICQGYWRNEEATRNTFDEDGFLRTGDVAIKKKGWYWIVDRKKELIKVKGFQVAPAELEAALLENEDVTDAAVTAIQLEHEERPRAYVVLRDGAKGKVSEKDIAKWIGSRVAKHKALTGGVVFIDEVPKSPSGKIQRKVMRDWAAKDAKSLTEMAGDMKAKL